MAHTRFTTVLASAVLLVSSMAGTAQDGRSVITPENAGELTQLIRLGRGSAESVAFSPDGSTVVVGGTAGVWLYDAAALDAEGEPPLLDTPVKIQAVLLSPDGGILAATSTQGEIVLWDTETWTATTIEKSIYGTDRMAFSPDGGMLARSLGSHGISIYDLASGEQLTLEGNFERYSDIAFSPDGRWLAGAGSDKRISLWDLVNNEPGVTLTGHTQTPIKLAFGPDNLLVSGASDGTLRVWDIAEGSELAQFTEVNDWGFTYIKAVVFSADGSAFASGDSGGNLVIWETTSRSPITQIDVDGVVTDLAFSPDGRALAAVIDETHVTLWNVTDGSAIATAPGHAPYMPAVTFSPDSRTLAISDFDSNLWLWDTATMAELNQAARIGGGSSTSTVNVNSIVFSADGRMLAAHNSFAINLYDAASHELLHALTSDGIVITLGFSPDGRMIGGATTRGLFIYDVTSGELLAKLADSNAVTRSVSWSPDQTLIAVSSEDLTTRVYGVPQ